MNKLDHSLDSVLRPERWDDYVGQEQAKRNLKTLIQAAKGRGEMPEHVLLHGSAGLGKTTLAHIIGKELGKSIQSISAPMVERVGDIVALASTLEDGGVLFIDEIHRLKKNIEESLYPIMETGSISIIVGKGPTAQPVTISLPPIILIGATTQVGKLSSPLRTRFSGGVLKLNEYDENEIKEIVKRSAKILKIKIKNDGVEEIAKRSRRIPRVANYLLKRVRDYAQVNNKEITKDIVSSALEDIEVDSYGLTGEDRRLLLTIKDVFNGGPVGIQALATTLGEDPQTIEEVYEPFLINVGFLERTPRGRGITKKGLSYLNQII